MRLYKYIIIVLLLTFTQCKKTNWYENFREKEKSPFGTYVIYNESENLFPNTEVELLKDNIYDYLVNNFRGNPQKDFGNYICIKYEANKLSQVGIQELIQFVYEGNDVFIALNHFNYYLKDALDFETDNRDEQVFAPVNLKDLKGTLRLTNDKFSEQEYTFDRNLRRHYFTRYNQKKTQVLGTQEINGKDEPVFIKIYHGQGAIYLHTQPIVFTNYFILKDTYQYAENVLSYLPDRKIIWDRHIRSSNLSESGVSNNRESVFKFFLQNPSLKWSLYLFLFALLLFILFNARRKQRAIPILEELQNSTVEFTHTIANLYIKENDHKNLVDKKIRYFLEKIRRKYLINTNNLNDAFIEQLAAKSGNSLTSTKYLINLVIDLNKQYECSQNELNRLNTLIENFFNHNTNGTT